MKHTAGNWHPDDKPIYFFASTIGNTEESVDFHKHQLIAVNELRDKGAETIRRLLDMGANLFVDSGVFSLASETAKKREISHDEALRLPLRELEGFDALYEKYCKVALEVQDEVWGIVEVDLGGRDQKRETRKDLESKGIRPIPVYHPLNDGWDYFDELAENYDRICVGNIVQASRYVRLRLIHTLWERKMRKAPKLWIHLLGLTPNEWLNAYPINSCDSSSWLSAVRWGGYVERTAQKSIGFLPPQFTYSTGSDHRKGVRMAAEGNSMMLRNYQNTLDYLTKGGLYDSGLVHDSIRRLPPMARRTG